MKQLLNTLYVTSENAYLSLKNNTVIVTIENSEVIRLPLLNIEGIVCFNYQGVSPALMGACADNNVTLSFMKPNGRFLARVTGAVQGNVLLRKKQYRASDDQQASLEIARVMIGAKVFNSRWILERCIRDHGLRVDSERLKTASVKLRDIILEMKSCDSLDSLRGYEGKGADIYFGVFDELILQQKDNFYFNNRNRRPPLDNTNALLSFTYTLISNEVASALEVVGLDPYVGFLHRDRPGRISLALDLMEELRPVMADRFVLSLINKQIVSEKNFSYQESGAVIMDDDSRKKVIKYWQDRKKEMITHPFLKEKLPWGLVPVIQSQLLARFIRGDIDAYPAFFWK